LREREREREREKQRMKDRNTDRKIGANVSKRALPVCGCVKPNIKPQKMAARVFKNSLSVSLLIVLAKMGGRDRERVSG
jgi:hypothetical protein